MTLRLERQPSVDGATLGALYLGDERLAFTLEDEVRDGVKVQDQTAIPFGHYQILMYASPRFKRMVPLLLNVPGFSAVEMHGGNDAEDTDGCILLGAFHTTSTIQHSVDVVARVQTLIAQAQAAGDPVWIDILEAPTERTLSA